MGQLILRHLALQSAVGSIFREKPTANGNSHPPQPRGLFWVSDSGCMRGEDGRAVRLIGAIRDTRDASSQSSSVAASKAAKSRQQLNDALEAMSGPCPFDAEAARHLSTRIPPLLGRAGARRSWRWSSPRLLWDSWHPHAKGLFPLLKEADIEPTQRRRRCAQPWQHDRHNLPMTLLRSTHRTADGAPPPSTRQGGKTPRSRVASKTAMPSRCRRAPKFCRPCLQIDLLRRSERDVSPSAEADYLLSDIAASPTRSSLQSAN